MSGHCPPHPRGWMDKPALLPGKEAFDRRSAWSWLVENARWQDGMVNINGKTVELRRGQLSHSFRFLARAWKWDDTKVRRFLQRLTDDGEIENRSAHWQNVITICNYDEYSFHNGVGDAASTQQRRSSDANYKQENSKEEHKPSVYDAGASPTLLDFAGPEPVKSKPAPHPVWSEGLEILAWAAGRSLPKDRDPVVRLLRRCQEAALGDDDMLIGVLRSVSEDMAPEKQTVAVIKALIAERGGAALKGKPRLVIDNKDPQGIQAWCRSIPGVQPAGPPDTRWGNWIRWDWVVDGVAGRVADAASLPTPCRMDWSLLGVWLSEGIEPDLIVKQIESAIPWLNQRGGYVPPSNLNLFDVFIRGARRSA